MIWQVHSCGGKLFVYFYTFKKGNKSVHGLPMQPRVSFSETVMLYPWLILCLYLHTVVIMFRSLVFILFGRKKFFDFWFIEKKTTLRQKILIYITLQTLCRVLPKGILILFIPKKESKKAMFMKKKLSWQSKAKIGPLSFVHALNASNNLRHPRQEICNITWQKTASPPHSW